MIALADFQLTCGRPPGRLVTALDAAGFSAEQDGRLGRYDVYRTDGTPGLVQIVFFAPDAANKASRASRQTWRRSSRARPLCGAQWKRTSYFLD